MQANDLSQLTELAQQLRVDSVRAAQSAGSGHPTSSMSAADLIAVLAARHLRFDFDNPDDPHNDHLIFSKGHATPLLYALYRAVGAITEEEFLTYRQDGSRLEGHPTPRAPWVHMATGSLGQGLPLGVGAALAGKHLDRLPFHVWVLCGDSELAEGSMWEAFEHAGYERLDNLIAVVDVNRLGQRGPTRHGWDIEAYQRRIRAFGWNTLEIDGHHIDSIDQAMAAAEVAERPTAILAHTVKGAGVARIADREGLHGKPIDDPEAAIAELGGERSILVNVAAPAQSPPPHRFEASDAVPDVEYTVGDEVATRTAFGDALAALGSAHPDVVGLDGEVADSTRMERFAKQHPDRYFECYIAEQQMLAAAVGIQALGWTPFAATFAAFLTRAYDFIRMAAIGRANLNLVGSHAGVAIGADGPSQMGLEDIACMRAVHGSTVLYPCDANQTVSLVNAMRDLSGISYLRTTRGKTPVLYEPGEKFQVGGSRVLRQSDHDDVTIVAAGITVHEALRAADELAERGTSARVIDLYSVKPLDAATLRNAAAATGRLITVEDHRLEGGLGEAVVAALATSDSHLRYIRNLAVQNMPMSGPPDLQLRRAGIDASALVKTVDDILSG